MRGPDPVGDLLEHGRHRHLARALELAAPALLVHRRLEAGLVDGRAVLLGDDPGQIEREPVGVVEHEGRGAGDLLDAARGEDLLVEQPHAALERLAKADLLLAGDLGDEAGALDQLGIDAAHLRDDVGRQRVEERLFDAQQPAVIDGAPHDPAQHVLAAGLVGKHAVGDQEGRRARVVGDGPQRDALPLVVGGNERLLRELRDVIDERAQEVGLVVGPHALQHGAEALEPHAGVDRRLRQRAAIAGRHLLELHEHQVPDLDPAIAVAGRALALAPRRLDRAVNLGALQVMDLAAGAAGAGLAHGPEVVLVAQADDAIVADAGDLLPEHARLVVGLVNGVDQPVGLDGVGLGQELVGEGDGVGLEVVAEREVPQHLEERLVARGAADVLQVVVLAPGAHALLRAGGAREGRLGLAGEEVLELVHPGVGEQQRRIIVRDQRRAGRLSMAALGEVVEEGATGVERQGRQG